MTTEKLYYDNSYLTDFCATVVGCAEDKKGFGILLDKTAFYPEGGGQPFDTGYILADTVKTEIFEVREKQGEIYHYAKTPLPVGTIVQGFINFERRFDLMQQHTGEHILSGLVKTLFGFENVGFHLSDKDMSVDFSGVLTSADITILMDKAQDIILQNQTVTVSFPSNVSDLEYRSKKAIEGKIRIVDVGQADSCACCGTHTHTTGEVISVAVFDSMSYKGGTRVFMACGGRVFKDYLAKNADCYKISHLLSSKVSEIVTAVEAKMSENDLLKQELAQLKGQLYSLWISQVPHGKLGFFEKESLTAGEAQRLAQLLSEGCEIALVASLQEDGTTKVCIISATADTNLIGNAICHKLTGKGGGKNGIFQCVVQDRVVQSVFESAVESVVSQSDFPTNAIG